MKNKKDIIKQLAEEAGVEPTQDKEINENDYDEVYNPFVKYSKKGFKYILTDSLAEELLGVYSFRTIYGKRTEDVYIYQDGIWALSGREIIKTKVEEMLKKHSTTKAVNEVFEKIKRLTAISQEEFDEIPEDKLCLQNGVYDLTENKLLPYSPIYYFKSKLPIHFIEGQDCPTIKTFFEETFYTDDIPVIQEWFGFHLFRKYFIKKAMILFGPTDTGKSVVLNLLNSFIGAKNISAISLHRISAHDKFACGSLFGKLGNIVDDLSFSDLSDAGGFKMATGGGYLPAEHKFGDPFQFMSFAKQTYATNKIPSLDSEHTDDAYYNRWLPICCDNQVSKEEQDKFLLQKLTTKEELAGLFNYALEGLQLLLKNGCFSFNKSIEEIKNIMEKHSDGLTAFVQDCLIKGAESSRISKQEMFDYYSAYAEKKQLKRLSKEQLGRRLEKVCTFITAKNDSKVRFWVGAEINFKSSDKDTFDTLLKVKGVHEESNKIGKNSDTLNVYMISDETSKVSKLDDTIDTFITKELSEEDKAKLMSGGTITV